MPFDLEVVEATTPLNLDTVSIRAVMEQESNNDPWAWNPEPKYHWFWNVKKNKPFRSVSAVEVSMKFPPKDFLCLAGDPDQEWWGQQASWGIMQVMGAVAREHGYVEPYLTRLVEPLTNLTIGCIHFAELMTWSRGLWTGLSSGSDRRILMSAFAAYNGGKGGNGPNVLTLRNEAYALSCLKRYDRIKKETLIA